MLHPSYTDLMAIVNSGVEEGEEPVVNSRYSIVLATARRARQLIDGADPMVDAECPKPLSIAIDELHDTKIRILTDEEEQEEEKKKAERDAAREAELLLAQEAALAEAEEELVLDESDDSEDDTVTD